MFHQYWKIIWWFFRVGVLCWFLLMPVLPIYGWLSPWPEAEGKLDAEGIRGIKLMIGSGGDSKREDGTWFEEKQRSYIVFPASLHSMEIFTYMESKGSRITGIEREVIRIRWAIPPLMILWILAGWFSARTVMLWSKKLKRQNR